MKAREHSEALLQSANLLGAIPAPGAGTAISLGPSTNAAGGGDTSTGPAASKLPAQGTTPDKQVHCPKESSDKK